MIFKKNRFPILVSLQKIWDKAPHNAMTDLIRYRDSWLCAFREGDQHVLGAHGCIRIVESQDGLYWTPIAFFKENGIDLRDPKLSVTPDGRLMLLVGGTLWGKKHEYISLQSRVAFSNNGRDWSPFELIIHPHEWLWRVTWYQGKAYGAAYGRTEPFDPKKEWKITLYESYDGLEWNTIVRWDIEGYPNETTLRFRDDGTMIALVRRERKVDGETLIGTSQHPFQNWYWHKTRYHLGGPNFLILPDQTMWALGRLIARTPYGLFEKTVFSEMTLTNLDPRVYLPSGGDCSYPGMVFYDGLLWITYYSTHEDKAAIYLARIAV